MSEVAIESGHELRIADGVSDVAAELARERRHPPDDHRGLDPIIQRGEMARPQATHAQSHAANTLLFNLRSCEQVIDRADVVPEHDPRPCESRRVDRAT